MKSTSRFSWLSAVLAVCMTLALASPATAQSMNVSINSGPPSSAFGAGAAQTGYWTKVPTKSILIPFQLNDLAGAPTTAYFNVAFGGSDLWLNDPSTFGDDEALLDGGYNIGPLGSSQVQLTGLINGTYDVYTYAWTPTHPTYTVSVAVQGSANPVQAVGGPFTGSYVLGVTHAKHTVTITNGQILIDVKTAYSTALVNGFQLVQSSSSAWKDLGNALPGTAGAPVLVGNGDFAVGTTIGVSLTNGLPNGSLILVVGGTALNAPLFGGTIVPYPNILLPPLPLGPSGSLTLASATPANVPTGVSIYVQGWIPDPGAPQGYAASNAVMATTP